MSNPTRPVRYAAIAAIAVTLAACATPPPPRAARRVAAANPPATAPAPAPAPVDPNVYAYPTKGQSQELADRDRYECHMWAVKQSGFDPSLPNVPPAQRVRVVGGPPPGANTAAGAVTGAVIGAAVSSYGHQAGGAVVGAVLGGAIGASADSANEQRRREVEADANARNQQVNTAYEQKATGYRRAATACLEGRGYNVR